MPAEPVFIDTSYVYALINRNDQWHSTASQLAHQIAAKSLRTVTTEFVISEIADGLASVGFRKAAAAAIRVLYGSADTDIVPASSELVGEHWSFMKPATIKAGASRTAVPLS